MPETWEVFDDARVAVDAGVYDGLGFVFNNNGIIGIDIDAGFDEDGFLSALSIDVMSQSAFPGQKQWVWGGDLSEQPVFHYDWGCADFPRDH